MKIDIVDCHAWLHVNVCLHIIQVNHMETILIQQKIVHTLLTMFQRQWVGFTGSKHEMVRVRWVKFKAICWFTIIIPGTPNISKQKMQHADLIWMRGGEVNGKVPFKNALTDLGLVWCRNRQGWVLVNWGDKYPGNLVHSIVFFLYTSCWFAGVV